MPQRLVTRFESSGGVESSRYAETMEYFARLAHASRRAKVFTFGLSPQGREIRCLVAAGGGEFSPETARSSGKAVVLIQNAIHAGEVEGKDALMLLLREILVTRERASLLDNLILLVIPILNVDGHERISAFNRPNQNGPKEMGWRTNALNLNLNRDYLKADAPEMKALLSLFSSWLPDFYIDNHCTDGADYQYHVTYDIETRQSIWPGLGEFAARGLMPAVLSAVERDGFLVGPYVEMLDGDLRHGIADMPSYPRLSTGYAATQNRLCLLVEAHALKPYENRVHSTRSMNIAVLEYLSAHHDQLRQLNDEADRETVREHSVQKVPFPIGFTESPAHEPLRFKGYRTHEELSPITGSNVTRYTAEPEETVIPYHRWLQTTREVVVPDAYVVPPELGFVTDLLKLHGVAFGRLDESRRCEVERYRFSGTRFASYPYEGRHLVEFDIEEYGEVVTIPAGAAIVPTAQRAMRVIVNLLEPAAPDSLARWGFFSAFFERKEYAEAYVMEPIARRMLEEDAELRDEFQRRLEEDESFKRNPSERLDFFYRRSVYFDECENVYPVMRLTRV